jgi:phosphopantothenoylcysteine decarboxylase / phosphopantothenate---cysteine ligase
MLNRRNIVLGVSGGIAVYKAADLASQLTKAGANVRVVMTAHATEFVSPMLFASLTGNEVVTDMFANPTRPEIWHIRLADMADLLVIAPATANIIAKLAGGIADDELTSLALATTAPKLICPSMHHQMYANPATQANLARLKETGYLILEPATGRLASGDYGRGRLPDTAEIISAVEAQLATGDDLLGKRIVVTAGGTREPIDPVRFISNRSSGKMGYALAEAARDRGAEVTLISAAALHAPPGMKVVKVDTAVEMRDAVSQATADCDALVMAAAVADYAADAAPQKIKKGPEAGLTLELKRTPDILAEVSGSFVRVGFAAESQDLIENARAKLAAKKLDIIVANDITAPESTFGADTNRITILAADGSAEELPVLPKIEVAARILDRVRDILNRKS